jgi:general secretion pathway protein J
MTRSGHWRDADGFTLIEALVATLLMALVMSALATLTAQWLPQWNRGLARVQRNEQVAIALDRIVADISAAEYVYANREVKQPLFEGGESAVTFIRSAIGPNIRPGLEIVRIAEVTDGRGRALVRTRAPFMPLPVGQSSFDQISFGDPVVLLRQPFRIAFEYSGGEDLWSSAWQGSSGLPSAVRLVVRDAAAARALAISTATRIHVDSPAPESEQNEQDTADPPRSAGGDVGSRR